MKLYCYTLALLLRSCLLANHVDAFTTTGLTTTRSVVPFYMQDTSDAITAATEASKKYGEKSPEARVAWELVEELDAANSHERKRMQDEEEERRAAEKAKRELILVKVPQAPTVHVDTADAVKNALEASRLYGNTSPEAKIAWDIVEELDAANSHHTFEDIHVAKPVVATDETKAPQQVKKKKSSSSAMTIEEAIDIAMFAKKIYGIHSVEARTAWDVVEEMDAAMSDSKRVAAAAVKSAAATAEAALKALEEGGKETQKEEIQLTDTSAAIKVALEASKQFGTTSVEAKMAWEAVEEIDSANAHRKTVGTG